MAYGASRAKLAFLYGTALAVTGFSLGTLGVCYWLDVWSFPAFARRMQAEVPSIMRAAGARELFVRLGFAPPAVLVSGASDAADGESSSVSNTVSPRAGQEACGSAEAATPVAGAASALNAWARDARASLTSLSARVLPTLGSGTGLGRGKGVSAERAAADASDAAAMDRLDDVALEASITETLEAFAAGDDAPKRSRKSKSSEGGADDGGRSESVWRRGISRMTALVRGGDGNTSKSAAAVAADSASDDAKDLAELAAALSITPSDVTAIAQPQPQPQAPPRSQNDQAVAISTSASVSSCALSDAGSVLSAAGAGWGLWSAWGWTRDTAVWLVWGSPKATDAATGTGAGVSVRVGDEDVAAAVSGVGATATGTTTGDSKA